MFKNMKKGKILYILLGIRGQGRTPFLWKTKTNMVIESDNVNYFVCGLSVEYDTTLVTLSA